MKKKTITKENKMKKLIKKICMAGLVGVMTMSCSFSSFAGQWIPEAAGMECQEAGPDGAEIVKKSGEIAAVIDVKTLQKGDYITTTAGDMYIARNYYHNDYTYYDKEFNYKFTIKKGYGMNSLDGVEPFLDGITLGWSTTEYGSGIYHYKAYDASGRQIYDLGVTSNLYRFMPGQDPYGMTLFAWTNYTDALRFISYSSATGFMEKIYYYSDYPILEKVNLLMGFENGKANLACETFQYVENEGHIGQRSYFTYENIASVDTLGIISNPIPMLEGEENVPIQPLYVKKNVADFDTQGYKPNKIGESGAYFVDLDGVYVLRDVTGADKFYTSADSIFSSLDFHITVIDENYFLTKPFGSTEDTPLHLYQIIYK